MAIENVDHGSDISQGYINVDRNCTLIISDLTIYIFRQATHVWEIKHDPIEPSFAHLFAPFLQLRCIHAVENFDFIFMLEGGNMRRRLGIFVHQSGPGVETRGHQGRAGVLHEERVREGEITLGESRVSSRAFLGFWARGKRYYQPSPMRRMRCEGSKGMVGGVVGRAG